MFDLIYLGASNEIAINGYTKHLSRRGWKSLNLSVGGCGSSAGVYQILKNRPVGARLAILSYEINELSTLEQGLRTELEILDNWNWIVYYLRSVNIIPVLLILPRVKGGKFFSSRARSVELGIARDLSVNFIDFTDIFCDLEGRGRSAERYMLDDSHSKPETAELIAEIIHGALTRLLSADLDPVSFSLDIKAARLALCETQPCGGRVEKGNSLISGSFSRVACQNEAHFLLGENEYISALGLNRGVSGANVRIVGGNGWFVKGLTFCANEIATTRFMFIVSDLKCVPQPADGLVKLEVFGADAALTEKTLQWQKPLIDKYGAVEIEYAVAMGLERRNVASQWLIPNISQDLLSASDRAYAIERLSRL